MNRNDVIVALVSTVLTAGATLGGAFVTKVNFDAGERESAQKVPGLEGEIESLRADVNEQFATIRMLQAELEALSKRYAERTVPGSPPTKAPGIPSEPSNSTTELSAIEYAVRVQDDQPPRSIASQIVYDPNRLRWRKQLVLFNGAQKTDVTRKMEDYLAKMQPPAHPRPDWIPYSFTPMAANGKPFAQFR